MTCHVLIRVQCYVELRINERLLEFLALRGGFGYMRAGRPMWSVSVDVFTCQKARRECF